MSNTKFTERMKKYFGHEIELIYDGTNLPDGKISPVILTGKINHIEGDYLIFKTKTGDVNLIIKEIKADSIKILEPA